MLLINASLTVVDMSAGKDTTVGFIGLGNMGLPMAKNILKAGYPLIVWNRTVQRAESIKQMGAQVAFNPKDLASRASIIITMLADPPALEEVVMGKKGASSPLIEGITPGKVLIDMTTNLPKVSRMIAEEVCKKGGEMLDAPVAGSVKPATEGALTILVGGKKEMLAKVRPVLETMGKKIFYIGGNGDGCSMKLALNIHLATMMASFAESLAFGAKSGLDPTVMLEVFNNSVLKTYISETKGQKIIDGDWTAAFALALMTKDLDLASESSKENRVPIPIASAAKEIYYACMANGKESLDFSAVAIQYEQMGNLRLSKKA